MEDDICGISFTLSYNDVNDLVVLTIPKHLVEEVRNYFYYLGLDINSDDERTHRGISKVLMGLLHAAAQDVQVPAVQRFIDWVRDDWATQLANSDKLVVDTDWLATVE